MDALEAVGRPELRQALLLVRSRRRPVSASDLAAAQRLHRNVARARLERLAAAGLVTVGFERRTGRSGPGAGRPAKVYSPAPETVGIEFPLRRYPDLVGLLVDALPAGGLRAVGVEFARRLAAEAGITAAAGMRHGLEQLCDALGRLGFQASVEEVGPGHAVIATPTCPLRPLVVVHPEAAEVDRGLWCGLVAAALDGACAECVDCETRDCLDGHASCHVSVRLRPTSG